MRDHAISTPVYLVPPPDFQHNSGPFHKYSEDSSIVRRVSDGQEEDNSAVNGFVGKEYNYKGVDIINVCA